MKVLILTISLLLASQGSAQIEARLFSGKQNRYAQADQIDSLAFKVEIAEQPSNFFIAFGSNFDLYVQFGESGHGFHVWYDGAAMISKPDIATTSGSYDVRYTITDSLRIYRNDRLVVTLQSIDIQVVRVGTWDVAATFHLPALGWQYFGSWQIPDEPVAIDTLHSSNINVLWRRNHEPDMSHYLAVLGDTVRIEHPDTTVSFDDLADGDWQVSIFAVNDEGMMSTPARKDFYILTETTVRDPYDFDGNGVVNMSDFNLMARHLGARSGDGMFRLDMDLHANGVIDVHDLRIWYVYWSSL